MAEITVKNRDVVDFVINDKIMSVSIRNGQLRVAVVDGQIVIEPRATNLVLLSVYNETLKTTTPTMKSNDSNLL